MAPSRGFSLLEMIIVLVLMGIAIGLVAPAVMRSAGVGREQRAMGDLAATLAARRLDAIRSGRVEAVVLRQSADELIIDMNESDRVLEGWPLVLGGETDASGAPVEVEFDARGRSNIDRVVFQSSQSPTRMWALVFDPVGGVPTAQRVTEATTP